MQQALEHVRREMGLEAVVLQTREVSRRRFLRRRSEVEVTAGLGVSVTRDATKAVHSEGQSRPYGSSQQVSGLIDRQKLIPETAEGIDLLSPSTSDVAPIETVRPEAAAQHLREGESASESLSERLQMIEELLQQFSQRTTNRSGESVPEELFHHYTRLVEADVPEEHARQFVLEVHGQAEPADRDGEGCTPQLLASQLESQFQCSGPIATRPGQQRIVALVGPTGVGKTTTIAKLAANFRLREGVKLGLVTVDTYRVAAVEQLRTYADIIDLPMKVVTNPLEMRRAIDELHDMDLILIDTAGRSPREELQLQELKALLAEAEVDEVHLVLSLATCPRALRMTAQKFAPVGVTSMILTKLDEAVGMGTLLGIARDIDWPMSYFTTGQDVPDDIETATAMRASRLILGKERLPHD